jgi:hypothetical protein
MYFISFNNIHTYFHYLPMIGDLGESLANVFLSKRTEEGHLFRTTMIGGKWPAIDLYAEIISDINPGLFCFFQIKTTEQGYTKKKNNLKVGIDLGDLIKFSQYSVPSYIIGIDYNAKQPLQSNAYIGTIRGNYTKRISSLPTSHPLNDANLILLKNEVVNFWANLNAIPSKRNYLTNFAI